MKLFFIAAIACCTLFMTARAEQQLLRMEASVSPNDIFLGESLQLTLFVHGYRSGLGEPDLSALQADIQLLAQQDRSQHSVQIVNGRQQITQLSGRMFTYRVTPQQPGTFSFDEITLKGPDGNSLPINRLHANVRPIPEQDHVKLWIDAPTHELIIDEEFDVTLYIRIRKPTRPFQSYSPIPEGTSPHLHIPFLDLHPGEGLKSENITQLLQRMVTREGESFHINHRTIGRDPFGGIFGNDQVARFRLPRTTDPDNEDYYLYELRSRWAADREGDYTFGPAGLRGNIITDVSRDGNARQDTIFAISDPVTVQVRTPPAQGRPATFIGASGTGFAIETTLDTQICQTGDPVTLTIEITGDGPPNRIRAPRLSTLEPLEQDFRFQPEPMRSESISGGRRFLFLIRPRIAGTLEIPALEIAYFDLATRTYQTIQSDPLPIRVNPATEIDQHIITDTAPRGRTRFSRSAPPGELPPAPFNFEPIMPTRLFRPAIHIPLFLLGPLCFLAVLLTQWLPKHIPLIQAIAQQRRALQLAQKQLASPGNDVNPVHVLRDYLVTAFDPAFGKGNIDRMQQILQERGMAEEDRDTLIHLLTETAYTGSQQAEQHTPLARQCLQTLSQLPPKRQAWLSKLTRASRGQTIIICIAGFITLSAIADQVRRFEERRTQLLLLGAQEQINFMTAANALADRIDQGERSPILLYNLGSALLLAEQPSLALPLLQWAERRGAPAWDVRRNMLIAQRNIQQNPTLQLPWIRTMLFWHYRISFVHRLALTAISFSLIWIVACIHRLTKRKTWYALPAAILLVLFGVSIAASLYAEWQNEQDWQMQRRQIQHLLVLLEEENNG